MPAKLVPAGFMQGADIQAFPLDCRQKHAWNDGRQIRENWKERVRRFFGKGVLLGKVGGGETKQDQLEENPLHFDEIVSPLGFKEKCSRDRASSIRPILGCFYQLEVFLNGQSLENLIGDGAVLQGINH